MISSVSCVFMITCYAYFKQYYEKLIAAQIHDETLRKNWAVLLKKKLIIFPLGVVIVVILYACSFTIIRLAPTIENVKLIRRICDLATVAICAVLFYLDKLDLDKKLIKDSAPAPKPLDEEMA